jgi:hypothetical protein
MLVSPFEDFDARLRQLTGDARHFWSDHLARERMLRAIHGAFLSADTPSLASATRAVDDAVTAGMRALGFSRDPVRTIRVRTTGGLGEKWRTCELDVDAAALEDALLVRQQPDRVAETWLHESVHARHAPWSSGWSSEYRHWSGYEEGFAEAVAKEIARLARFGPGVVVYRRYRAGYDLLADALGLPRENLFRVFWQHENGAMRQAFTDVVDALYHQTRGRTLTLRQRHDIQTFADDLFATRSSPRFDASIEQQIRQEWQRRLP